jgi:pimeloyl-ACP methyl ester carboxylesterase
MLCGAATPLAAQTPDATGPATFVVMLRGARVGTETASLSKVGSGWLLSGTGRLGAPFDVITNKFEVNYAADWQPMRMTLQGSVKGQPLSVATTFGLTTALNDVAQGAQRGSNSHQIQSRAIVLPSGFFASYEILAARIGSATPGTRFPVYVAPDGETSVAVERVTDRRISLGDRTIDVRVFAVSLAGTASSSNIELWLDDRNRLARLEMPAVSIVVIREDLASVMAREEPVRNPRDEDAFIPANGFSLGTTITRPAAAPPAAGARGNTRGAPAVILVAGSGPQDRDYTTYGVPIFGQLAGALSDAGYFVVRYDARGIGRSGGRVENSTLAEYADDVVRAVKWLRDREDVDDNRIAVVGYGDAGPVAMLAAEREDRIKALALVAAPGRSGREVTLEQQAHVLSRLSISDVDRANRITVQQRLIDAVVTDKGWEAVPPELRTDARSPWFRSWLLFDPAVIMRKLKQPVLIVHGTLDTETPSAHADALELLSSQRNKIAPTHTRKVIVPGINHLLVPARTGGVDEYATLETLTVAPAVKTALTEWLATAVPPSR